MPRKKKPTVAQAPHVSTIVKLDQQAVEVLWAIESERRILAEIQSPVAEVAREALLSAADYVIQATAGDYLCRYHIEQVLIAAYDAQPQAFMAEDEAAAAGTDGERH